MFYPEIATMTELADAYEEFLNDTNPEVSVAGVTYGAGEVLRAIDSIAFRCGYFDYADYQGIDTDDLEDDLD